MAAGKPAELKPYVRMRRCPKCAFYPATTEYRAGFHGGYTIMGGPVDETCRHPQAAEVRRLELKAYSDSIRRSPFVKPTEAEIEEHREQYVEPAAAARSKVREHFERECPNCHYRWAEDVLDA